jgi:ABC-type glycerol-3-phosphate transport system substrate-binding protein
LQTSANERAFGFLQQLMRLGCAWTPLEQNPHLYLKERKALFYSGSMQDLIRQGKIDMKDDWEMIPYPSLEGSEVILSDGLSYGILHSDANHDLAAWLFIRWLQAPQNLAKMIVSTSTLPPVSSVREEVKKIGKHDPAWELSLQYLPLVKSMPLLATWLDAGKVLQDAAWQVVQSNTKPGDVSTILADAELLIKEILNR